MKKHVITQPQFVVNDKGKPVGVFLKIKDYEALLEELDELYTVTRAEKIIESNAKTYSLKDVEKKLFGKKK